MSRKMKRIRAAVVGSLIIILIIFGVVSCNQKPSKNQWAETTIGQLPVITTIPKYKDGFKKEDKITKGDASIIVADLIKVETKSVNYYMDLKQDYYTDAVLKLSAANMIKADDKGKVYPNEPLKFKDGVKMLAVIIDKKGDKETEDQIYKHSGFRKSSHQDKEMTGQDFIRLLDGAFGGYYNKPGTVKNMKFGAPVIVAAEGVEFTGCKFKTPILVTANMDKGKVKVTGSNGNKIEKIENGTNIKEDAPYDFQISTYDTKFDPTLTNRCANLQTAITSIDKTIVQPGEVFSFNEATGKKTYDKGYKDGIIVAGGKLVPGFAGGVCQVSTTTWNAAIESGVAVLERHPHTLEFTYVPPGRDATIYEGVHDLRFKNTYPVPIMVKTKYDPKGVITVGIYAQGYVEKPEIEIVTTKTGEWSYITERKVNGVVDYKHVTNYQGLGF